MMQQRTWAVPIQRLLLSNNTFVEDQQELPWCYVPLQFFSGLVQDCSISSVWAMDILQSCTMPSICALVWMEFTCLTLYKAAPSFSFHGGLYQPMAFVTNDTLVLKALFIVITHPQRRCWFSAKQLTNHCSNQWQHSSQIFIYITRDLFYSWWRHQMETFSASLALCEGNSPVTGEFPSQRPVMLSFDVFFNLHLNKGLSKQSWGWQFEMPSHPLWCHCNANRDHLNQQWILGMD